MNTKFYRTCPHYLKKFGRPLSYEYKNGYLANVSYQMRDLGFCCSADDVFDLLRCYEEQIGSWLPTFQDNILVQFSKVKQSKENT